MLNERFKKAIKSSDLTTQKVAEAIGLKVNTLRKALLRNSLNEGYLILIEETCGISKKWLKNGETPMFIASKEEVLHQVIAENAFEVLEKLDKEKIIAYILLKEKEFMSISSFVTLIEKVKVSQKISEIVNKKQ